MKNPPTNEKNHEDEKHKNENVDNSSRIVKEFPGYDLYIFPELSVTGYSKNTFEQLNLLAEAPDDSSNTFKRFSKLAKEVDAYIIYGIPTYFYGAVNKEKQYHISAFVVSPEGKLEGVYNKNYLFTIEQDYFQKGWGENVKDPLMFVNINDVMLGLVICYDMRFPELWRELSMNKRVVAYLQQLCIEKDFSFNTWHTIITARAVENLAYVLSLNRAGNNFGGSIFVQPGTPNVKDYQLVPTYQTLNNNEGVIGGVIDKDVITEIRNKVTIIKDGSSNFPKYKNLEFTPKSGY